MSAPLEQRRPVNDHVERESTQMEDFTSGDETSLASPPLDGSNGNGDLTAGPRHQAAFVNKLYS